MADRFQHLKTYLDSWDDAKALAPALADGFKLLDPHEAEPITAATMGDWMQRWVDRMKAAGGTGGVDNSDEAEIDRDGELIHWTWWRFTGTDVEGSALIKVGDDGVRYQKVAYHKAPTG